MINNKTSKNKRTVLLLLGLCVLLLIVPFIVSAGSSFGGADDAAVEAIEKIAPDYIPWAEPIAEIILGGEIPGETMSLLFCLQSALGAGILCYGFGYLVARKKFTKEFKGI